MGLALSCVVAAFGLCLRAGNQLLASYDLEGVAGLFSGSFLLGVVLLCVAVLVSAHDGEQRRWSIGVGLVCGMLGATISLLANALPSAAGAAGSGLLLGFGLACLLRQWGRYYRFLSYRGALLTTALSFLIASCLELAMEFAGTPFLFCLGLLVLVVCGGLPLLARDIVRADEIRAGFLDADAAPKPISTMYQAVRGGWMAVVGLVLNCFALGMAFWPGTVDPLAEAFSARPVAYAALFAVTAWVVSRARATAGGIMERFCRASLLLAAAAALASQLLAGGGGASLGASVALSVLSHLSAAVFNVLGLVVLFWTAKSSDLGFSKVFALFCASCAVGVAAGMAASRLLELQACQIMPGLHACYLGVMALAEGRRVAARRRASRAALEAGDGAKREDGAAR